MSDSSPCRLVTRKSPLALKQAETVAHLVEEKMGLKVDLIPMTTSGDQRLDWSLQKKGGKGLFTRELEQALLEKRADIAVHSAKDMPTDSPSGLALSAFLKREDVRDVLVLRNGINRPTSLASGSPRRISQLKTRFPEIKWLELRGNVETRLKKIAQEHQADGTILAAAGLHRLGIKSYPGLNFEYMQVSEVVPAAGQAAIALQTRKSDRAKFSALGHLETETAVGLERSVLRSLGGGCLVALGIYFNGRTLHFFHDQTGSIELSVSDFGTEELIAELKKKIS